MLKKKLLSLFLLSLTATQMISANSYGDRGLYGKLSYLYNEDEYLNQGSKYITEQGTQTYMMGYAGNIYSPKLFDYTIETAIRYEDSKRESDSSDSSSIKSDSQDYNLNMNFINGSNFPFRVSLSEQNKVIADSKYTTERKSLNGDMKFDPLNINYGVSKSSAITQNGNTIGVSDYDNYNAGLSYRKDTHNLNIRYLHTEQTFNQKYADYNLTTYRDDLLVNDQLSINYNWKISKDLDFDSSGSYDVDKYSSTKSSNADMNLRWNPDAKKYRGSLSVRGSRYEYGNTQDGNDSKSVLDMLTINQNLIYQVMESLSLYETTSVTTFSSPTSKGTSTMASLSANHNYGRNIFSDSKLQLSTSASATQSQSKTEMILENKTNSTNNGSYAFNTSANINKPLRSMASNLNFNAGYSHILNTTDNGNSATQTYSAGSSLSSTFSFMRNNLNINVVKSDSETMSTLTTRISDTINASTRLGIRGNMGFNAGVNHSSYKRDDSSIERTNLSMGTNISYRFFTKLMFNMNANINKDIVSDYLAYSGSSGLSYSAGKTSMSINYMYNKTEYLSQIGGSAYETQRTNLRAMIERRF
jgi:hypothetical protein